MNGISNFDLQGVKHLNVHRIEVFHDKVNGGLLSTQWWTSEFLFDKLQTINLWEAEYRYFTEIGKFVQMFVAITNGKIVVYEFYKAIIGMGMYWKVLLLV